MNFYCDISLAVGVVGTILASIVGGFIAGYFALRGVKKTFEHQLTIKEDERNSLLKGVYQAIHDEVDTLWNTYIKRISATVWRL